MHDCEGMAVALPGAADVDVASAPVQPDIPVLCLQGSPKGDQHSDSVQPPPVSPLPAVLLAVARDDRIASLPTLMAALERDLSRSQSPPKSIVHCCFRI